MKTNQPVSSEAALLLARQALYRFATLSLLDPQADNWERLAALRSAPILTEAAALIRSLPEAVPDRMGRGEKPLNHLDPQGILTRLPASHRELDDQYVRHFGLLVSNACPPYETEYINSKFDFQRSNALADISGFYGAFGLCISVDHPERSDHIVLELEFMANLIGLEVRATSDSGGMNDERSQICRNAQSRFVREHLAWWVPAFARLLQRENPNGFYAAVGDFLAALIPAERALLSVESATDHVGPTAVERPEACEGCQLLV